MNITDQVNEILKQTTSAAGYDYVKEIARRTQKLATSIPPNDIGLTFLHGYYLIRTGSRKTSNVTVANQIPNDEMAFSLFYNAFIPSHVLSSKADALMYVCAYDSEGELLLAENITRVFSGITENATRRVNGKTPDNMLLFDITQNAISVQASRMYKNGQTVLGDWLTVGALQLPEGGIFSSAQSALRANIECNPTHCVPIINATMQNFIQIKALSLNTPNSGFIGMDDLTDKMGENMQ